MVHARGDSLTPSTRVEEGLPTPGAPALPVVPFTARVRLTLVLGEARFLAEFFAIAAPATALPGLLAISDHRINRGREVGPREFAEDGGIGVPGCRVDVNQLVSIFFLGARREAVEMVPRRRVRVAGARDEM